ncbi:hypothetical protein NEAUS04_0032 [Nematocida ausubeli]|uniref:Uncharacterized protein n=1 Tax=Nematocida ausubeli (strain ATCC PRA-371 / ERTm2) TaxID=1913371 RepID=A0A086IZY8_NEMA1|nr:uncharacterized protein NESG_02231 [Nematocida ausubeli]KAI5132047.1 hypothetical protein NEAUS07_0046 [Nematocida ausubeli]KAI5132822.1 hypothetical protein NEAUS06_0368 [Nematocida ausubeli]KAI5147143.1 hypothetical protein NEAUS05_0468 [Nematocida ausubeli]KAI5160498.1 hypothetical protein NEAUS04_0032 [Nematocida ausubeli]KFG25456.1 hypothetical protein NESG_02231 [Nematocida ausubeli]
MINIKSIISIATLALLLCGQIAKAGSFEAGVESMTGLPQGGVLGLCNCFPNASCQNNNLEKLAAAIRSIRKTVMKMGNPSQCLEPEMLMSMGVIPPNTGTECLDILIKSINPFQILSAENTPKLASSYNSCTEFHKSLLGMLNLRLTGGYAAMNDYMSMKNMPNACGNSSFIGFGNPSGDFGACGCGSSLLGGMGGMSQPSMCSGGMPQPSMCSGGLGGMGGIPQPSMCSGGMPSMPQPSMCSGGMGGLGSLGGLGGMGSPCPCGMGGMPQQNSCAGGMSGMGEFSSLGMPSGIIDVITQLKENSVCPPPSYKKCLEETDPNAPGPTNVRIGNCCGPDLNAMMIRSIQQQQEQMFERPKECPLSPPIMMGMIGATQIGNAYQRSLKDCQKAISNTLPTTQVTMGCPCEDKCQSGMNPSLFNTNLGLSPGLDIDLSSCPRVPFNAGGPCMKETAGEMAKLTALQMSCY